MKINFRKPDGDNVIIDMPYVPSKGDAIRLGEINTDVFYVESVIHQPKDLWKAMIRLSYFPDSR